jgi:hypothetical protein
VTEGGHVSEFEVEPCPLCGASVIYATDDQVKVVPVDAQPSKSGTHVLRPMWGMLPRASKPSARLAFGLKLREIHDKTCPKGSTLRRRGR